MALPWDERAVEESLGCLETTAQAPELKTPRAQGALDHPLRGSIVQQRFG